MAITTDSKDQRGSLTDLPPEIIDLIVSHLPHPSDLLPLALTHSAIRDIIIPEHLNYRYIDRAVDDGTMWDHLEENPRRLASVRFLTLRAVIPGLTAGAEAFEGLEGVAPRLPRFPVEASLCVLPPGLLSQMKNLLSLNWQDHSMNNTWIKNPRSFTSALDFVQYQDSLWSALKSSCQSLEELEVRVSLCAGLCSRDVGQELPVRNLYVPSAKRSLTFPFIHSNLKELHFL